jgi:hypothetical protein
MKIEIYDHATGKQITRDMTAKELKANEAMQRPPLPNLDLLPTK